MSSPRDPRRDLRLERFGDRDGLRPAPLGEVAHAASPLGQTSSTREALAAYQALIDAVFTAPGASEWLVGLRRMVAALLAAMDRDAPPRGLVSSDAIRAADPRSGRV